MVSNAAACRWRPAVMLVGLVAWLGLGCSPDSFLVADEDRERNLQRARESFRQADWEGSAEFYERAIEKNPRSASAHLEYAALCESRLRRDAEAVYHYGRFLRLKPETPNAADIRQRITNCTERLATTVPLVVRSETIARDLAALRGENLVLRSQVTNLTASMTYWSNEWARVNLALAAAAAQGSGNPIPPGEGTVSSRNEPRARSSQVTPPSRSRSTPLTASPSTTYPRSTNPTGSRAVTGSRYHRVQSGETMARIARRYGVSLPTLLRANPQIEPKRLRAGQNVRIP